MGAAAAAYDKIVERVKVVLPNHRYLGNPYRPDENDELSLRLGVGVAIGSGENALQNLCQRLGFNRRISIVITRKAYALESQRDNKETPEKSLMDDQIEVIRELLKDPTEALVNVVAKIQYSGDAGIEYVFSGKENYVMIRSDFDIVYEEDLFT